MLKATLHRFVNLDEGAATGADASPPAKALDLPPNVAPLPATAEMASHIRYENDIPLGSDSAATDSPSRRTMVVLQTHYLNRALRQMFQHVSVGLPGYSACILMHHPPGTSKPRELQSLPHHFVTTPEIRDPAYFGKSSGEGWSLWQGGHTDLIAMHFFKTYPTYDQYWFIEYDVRFSGAWSILFSAFEDSDADFLSSTIRRASNDPEWPHWSTLSFPASVGFLPAPERLCSFAPIVRISRRGLQAIDKAYRDGWTGHCEATWPTVLAREGYKVEDFGGDGEFVRSQNRRRFYTNTVSNHSLSPGSFVFRPVRWMPGLKRNFLWHPVKPLNQNLRDDARRLGKKLRRYLTRQGPTPSG